MDHKYDRFDFSGNVVISDSISKINYKMKGSEIPRTLYMIDDMPGLITVSTEKEVPFNELNYTTQHRDTS